MGITANGYETTPIADVLSMVQSAFKTALGDDLELTPESPQGNLINMLVTMLHEIDMHRQSDFYARDIYKAEGLQLDIIGRELGMTRKLAIPTQILISLKGAVNFTIPKGTLVNSVTDNSQTFEFTTDYTITSEIAQVTLVAANNAVYDDITVGQQLQTQEYMPQIYDMDVVSITYGTPKESDYSFRMRLIDARSSNVDEVKHLTLALEGINNVLKAYVEPNNTLEVSPTGIPPHAVEIVVLGGAEADIANVLMGYLFATPTYQDPTLGEAIQGIDYNGHVQTFYITRPKQVDVTINITYKNKPGQTLSPEDIANITDKLKQLVNSVYMNKTIYASDICSTALDGYSQLYSINNTVITVAGTAISTSYTCSTREYLYATEIVFTEVQ